MSATRPRPEGPSGDGTTEAPSGGGTTDVPAEEPSASAREAREVLVGEELRVRYGGRTVLDVPRVALREGELLAVLGPNGAGKSTLLRVLAMLERPTSGRVRFRGLGGQAAERALRRGSAAVFQRPHLWHETVGWNVGLGLRLRGLAAARVHRAVAEICDQLGLAGLREADAVTLSGGQAQRVALARALVLEPEVLFLDEPTSDLDAPAREELRADLERAVRARAGSVLLITHDRTEAFYLADRVVVLEEGRPAQVGTPAQLYEEPSDAYVAQVTGAELGLRGQVTAREEGLLAVEVEGGLTLRAVGRCSVGEAVKVAYRPEDLVLGPPEAPEGRLSPRNRFHATVREVRPVAGLARLRLEAPTELVAVLTRSAVEELGIREGSRVSVRVKATALHAFPV